MNNYEKLLDILQKTEITKEDKAWIDSLIASDPEAKKLYDVYTKVKNAFKSDHISFSDLQDYVLYKNGMKPENNGIIKSVPSIEAHLKSCEECSNEFKVLNEEYSGIESFLSAELNRAVETKTDYTALTAVKKKNQWLRTPVYAFTTVIAAGFLYLSLLLISNAVTPESYKIASLDDQTEFYVTRGRTTVDFGETLKALDNKEYEKAILHLKSDIEKNPDDETIFYSYYILGLTYMETAGSSFLGLFPSYDNEKAQLALESFKNCIDRNTSGRFPDITYNAYFYSAKASLMLDDTDSAKEYLRIVVNEKGSKMSEAQNMLNELE